MTKRHQTELMNVAEKVYDAAVGEIQEYINKTYGSRTENTLEQQLEDYHIIAEEVAAFLMGNAMAMIDESSWDEDLQALTRHVRQVAAYAVSKQSADLAPKK